MKRYETKLKKLAKPKKEDFDKWYDNNESCLPLKEKSGNLLAKRLWIGGLFSLLASLCIVLSVIALMPKPPLPFYGQDDLAIFETTESYVNDLGVTTPNLDNWQDKTYFGATVIKTNEIAYVNERAARCTENEYAEVEITILLMDNVNFSGRVSYDKCNKKIKVDDLIFYYTQGKADDVFYSYLIKAKIGKASYYITLKTLEDKGVEKYLQDIFK